MGERPPEGQAPDLETRVRAVVAKIAAETQDKQDEQEGREQIAKMADEVKGIVTALGRLVERLAAVEQGQQELRERIPADFCTKFPELCNVLQDGQRRGHAHTSISEALACEHCGPRVSEELRELQDAARKGQEGEIQGEATPAGVVTDERGAEPESTAEPEPGQEAEPSPAARLFF